MKKLLSLLLAILTLSAICLSVITVSATSGETIEVIEFGKTYKYTYTDSDKSCEGQIIVPSDGMITVNASYPENGWTKFIVNNGFKNIIEQYSPKETFYLFLSKGTYTFSFIENGTKTGTGSYNFTHQPTFNNKVNPIQWNTKYTHYYNSNDCYGSFKLTTPSTVTFNLTQPLNSSGSANSSKIQIIDGNENGKIIKEEYFSSSEDFNIKYSVRLAKGKYKFNYYSSSLREKYYCDDLLSSTYKLSYKKAEKPITPKLSVKNSKIKYTTFSSYNTEIDIKDNPTYDGIQVWTKTNNGKWKLKEDNENGTYYRYTHFYLNETLEKNDNVYYKIRAYSYYGKTKKYSDFTTVSCLDKSFVPKKPSTTVKSPAKKTAKIYWDKNSKAKGYEVYYSVKKNSDFIKVKSTTATTFTQKGLKSKQTYYYKVRSYTQKHGVTLYSAYSTVKSINIK